jgi:hypothetical protein
LSLVSGSSIEGVDSTGVLSAFEVIAFPGGLMVFGVCHLELLTVRRA